MKLHEYQGKELLAKADIPTPAAKLISSVRSRHVLSSVLLQTRLCEGGGRRADHLYFQVIGSIPGGTRNCRDVLRLPRLPDRRGYPSLRLNRLTDTLHFRNGTSCSSPNFLIRCM